MALVASFPLSCAPGRALGFPQLPPVLPVSPQHTNVVLRIHRALGVSAQGSPGTISTKNSQGGLESPALEVALGAGDKLGMDLIILEILSSLSGAVRKRRLLLGVMKHTAGVQEAEGGWCSPLGAGEPL